MTEPAPALLWDLEAGAPPPAAVPDRYGAVAVLVRVHGLPVGMVTVPAGKDVAGRIYTAGVFGSGANIAFRTAELRALGGFDERLGVGSATFGGDHLAAFFDVLAAGHKLVYEPGGIVRHRYRDDLASLRRTMYGYGAGLSAYLTRTVLEDPRRIREVVMRVPRGLALAPRGAAAAQGFPRELRWVERRGMAAGPFHYLRSRRAARAEAAA